MATPLKSRVAIPRIRDNKIDGVKYNRSSSKRNNFEMFAWLGMRLRCSAGGADLRPPVCKPHGGGRYPRH